MKKIVFAAALLLLAIGTKIETQSTASYGALVTSLTTTSAGAVTGTSFGVPQGSASIITWSVVADGSAISTTLEGSLDNTTWFTVDTITTPATGAVKNYGFTSIKFVRISQVSRTGGTTTTGTIVTSRAFPVGTPVSGTGGTTLAADGTALLPSYSFASEPTLGLWRSAAGLIQVQGNLIATGSVSAGTTSEFTWGQTRSRMRSPADGVVNISNLAVTIGSQLKVDALPTIASGFGTSPSIVAGSTPFAGAVNVGTGGVATSGVINFNGTAFPSGPFCVCAPDLSNTTCRLTTTTTTLTMTANTAWPANDIIKWICVSSK